MDTLGYAGYIIKVTDRLIRSGNAFLAYYGDILTQFNLGGRAPVCYPNKFSEIVYMIT